MGAILAMVACCCYIFPIDDNYEKYKNVVPQWFDHTMWASTEENGPGL